MESSYNSELSAEWPYEPEHVRTRLYFWQSTLTHRADSANMTYTQALYIDALIH